MRFSDLYNNYGARVNGNTNEDSENFTSIICYPTSGPISPTSERAFMGLSSIGLHYEVVVDHKKKKYAWPGFRFSISKSDVYSILENDTYGSVPENYELVKVTCLEAIAYFETGHELFYNSVRDELRADPTISLKSLVEKARQVVKDTIKKSAEEYESRNAK